MAEITAFEAKNRLGRLLDRVESGEEITITRHGEAVARLIPVTRGADRLKKALQVFAEVRNSLAKRANSKLAGPAIANNKGEKKRHPRAK
jgi:prevent-host-death family protein